MKTAIMPHGLHVEAHGWEEIVWGIPPERLGRATKAIQLAVETDASLVIFGTGASKRDGVFEAQCMVNLMWERFSRLKEFRVFDDYNIDSLRSLRQIMQEISVVETRSTNTVTEIQYGFERCVELGIDRVILTSSPGHLGRCELAALKIRGEDYRFKDLRISGEASDVNFFQNRSGQIVEANVTDTAIFEPSHRGDDPLRDLPPDLQPNWLFPRIFRVTDKPQCLEEIAGVFHCHDS